MEVKHEDKSVSERREWILQQFTLLRAGVNVTVSGKLLTFCYKGKNKLFIVSFSIIPGPGSGSCTSCIFGGFSLLL